MGWLKKIVKGVGKVIGAVLKPVGKLLKKWLAPKVPDKEALKVQRQGSDQFIPVVYGTRTVGAIIVDKNVTDASGGADNEFLHLMAVFCYGEIDGFEEFFFNGISENDERWRKDKNNPNSAKWFTKEVRTGAAAQTAVNAVGKLNRFSATDSRYEGLAVAFFTFQQDKDQSIWNGQPEITARLRGKKCFDPRTGLTAYTENPAIHLLDYLKSTIYGKGLSDDDLDVASFVAVANMADSTNDAIIDQQVCRWVNGVYVCNSNPASTFGFKRFTHNNIIDTQQTIFQNMEEIAQSFRGFFPDSDGRIKIATESEASPVFAFDESNIVSSITSSQPGRNDRFNRCVVRFPNKANKYEMDECFWPLTDDPLYQQFLNEDNGVPLENTITVETCVYKAEALQLAELAVTVSRNAEAVEFTATHEAMECDVGDVVSISEINRGWSNREFRISEITYRDDGLVNIAAVQHSNALYPWSVFEYSDIVGGSNLGDPANIPAPTALSIEPDPTFATAGLLTWSSQNNAFIRRFEITVLSGVEVIYRTESMGQSWPVPLFNAGSYSIQVRAVSSIGTLSPAATIAFNLTQSQPPSDIDFTLSNFEIEARPVLSGRGLGTVFEFAIDDTSTIRGRGVSLVFTGLSHDTEYTIFARTVNALGISAWFSKVVSTTADGTNLIDLIGEGIGQSIFDDVVTEVQGDLSQIVQDSLGDYSTTIEVNNLINNAVSEIAEGFDEDPRLPIVEIVNNIFDDYETQVLARDLVMDEASTRAGSIEQLNIVINDESATRSLQINQVQAAITDETSARQSAITQVNQALADETSARTTQINALTASVATETSQRQADISQVNQAIADEAGARASAVQQLNATINGVSLATNSRIDSVEADVDGNAQAISAVEGVVYNPATGLSASYSLAQTAKTTSDGNAVSITQIQNTINNPTSGLSATFTQGVNNTNAISALQTRVNTVEGDVSQAELLLQSTVNELGEVSSRAFLGVTTTVGGVSRINGIVIDGATNALEFRADTFRLTNTAGQTQMFWSSGLATWVFNGSMVAGSVTSSSITSSTISASTIIGTEIQGSNLRGGVTITGEGPSSQCVKIVSGTPFGTTGKLIEWFGPKSSAWYNFGSEQVNLSLLHLVNPAAALSFLTSDGVGFIKGDFFQGQIIESKQATNTTSFLPVSVSVSHQSEGKGVRVGANGSFRLTMAGNTTGTIQRFRINISRNSTTIRSVDGAVQGIFDSELNRTDYFGQLSDVSVDNRTTIETRNYQAQFASISGPSGTIVTSTAAITIDTYENKLAS